jgi:hypothetical protein
MKSYIVIEDESMIGDLQRQLKEEKHARKTSENSLTQLQEEMSDLQEAKRALEKVYIVTFCSKTSVSLPKRCLK